VLYRIIVCHSCAWWTAHTNTHPHTHAYWHVSCSYVLLLLKVFVGFIALLLSCGRSAFARISIFVFLYIFHVSLCIFWFFVSATGNWKYLSNNVIILWGTLSCVGIWGLCWPSDDLEGQRTRASVRTKVRNIEFIICCVSKSSSLPVLLGATLTSEDANSLTYTSMQSSWRIHLVQLEAAAFLLTHRKSRAPDLVCYDPTVTIAFSSCIRQVEEVTEMFYQKQSRWISAKPEEQRVQCT